MAVTVISEWEYCTSKQVINYTLVSETWRDHAVMHRSRDGRVRDILLPPPRSNSPDCSVDQLTSYELINAILFPFQLIIPTSFLTVVSVILPNWPLR